MPTPTFRPALPRELPGIAATDSIPGRREVIAQAIQNGECHVALLDEIIAGYAILTYDFFGCAFIELLIVAPQYRRQGVGQGMISYLKTIAKTPKLFTSTNESNLPMQGLLGQAGFRGCGYCDALDEGDPELFYVWEKGRGIALQN